MDDPWSFGSEEKGLLFSDEIDFPLDAFARSRKALMEWELKPSYSFENDELVTIEAAESVEFTGFGFTDVMGEHFRGGEIGSDSSKQVASPTCLITPNSSFGEVESGWKLSGSVMECNSHESSLIALKLGRLGDCNDANISKERSAMAKRARTVMSSYSPRPFCQVQGCNRDLSSSKDYHKRHKVCEAHSKTSRVIVNGIEQRFCQQCSRFHLLAEFDDGKRSCRKRLAGHNERRRKPQLDSICGKSHIFLQSIQGARFLGGSFPKKASFIFPDKHGEANQCCHIKFGESLCSPQLTVPMMNGSLLAKPFPHLHNIGKIHDQELSESSNSSCALSLLSTQSQDFSSTLIFPGGRADHVGDQISGKTFYSSVPNPTDIDHTESMMLPDSIHDADGKGIFLCSGFADSKQHLSPQGTTVDLLQLSSHLHRVEQQRSSLQIKQENDDFFGFLST